MLLVDASCHKSVVSVVCLSVCLCVGHTAVRAKPTMRQTFFMVPRNHVPVLHGQWCIGGYMRVYGIYQPPVFF